MDVWTDRCVRCGRMNGEIVGWMEDGLMNKLMDG